MLPSINEVYSQQARRTEDPRKEATMLICYAHVYPNTTIRYHTSDMQLYIYLDTAYLMLPNARSTGTGYFYLSDGLKDMTLYQSQR